MYAHSPLCSKEILIQQRLKPFGGGSGNPAYVFKGNSNTTKIETEYTDYYNSDEQWFKGNSNTTKIETHQHQTPGILYLCSKEILIQQRLKHRYR